MKSTIVTLLLLMVAALSLATLISPGGLPRLPGNDQGYEPVQPIAFSHRLHAGELEMDCLYCHSSADKSRHAGTPAAGTCMNCHKSVRATFGAVRAEDELAVTEKREPRKVVSPELAKLYDAVGIEPDKLGIADRGSGTGDERIVNPTPDTRNPIEWVQIHKLPDFVYFDHSAHVNAGVECQTCHGPVETMERVRQVEDLSMGWCVNCHRDSARNGINGVAVQPSTDCGACHY